MDYKIEKFEKHSDQRGQLVVFLKNSNLQKIHTTFGQIYFVTFNNKGIVRGNHYHKKWREWFGVINGKVKVKLEDTKTKEVVIMELDGDSETYTRLETGPEIAHAFESITDYAALINYANNEWHPNNTFDYKLLPE